MCPFYIVCKLVFVPTELGIESGSTFSVSFQIFSLQRLNFTPRIIRVLRAFRFIWSSTSYSNCSIFLEYSSNLKFVILLFSSNCSNLLVLFSANVLVWLTLVSVSFNLLIELSIHCIVNTSCNINCTVWDFLGKKWY